MYRGFERTEYDNHNEHRVIHNPFRVRPRMRMQGPPQRRRLNHPQWQPFQPRGAARYPAGDFMRRNNRQFARRLPWGKAFKRRIFRRKRGNNRKTW